MYALALMLMTASIAPVDLAADDLIPKDRLKDLILGLYAPIRDVEYQYEGTSRLLVKPDYSKLPKELRDANKANEFRNQDYGYQGTFAYRNDGAFHLDLYRRPFDATRPTTREIHSLLDHDRGSRRLVPDQGGPVGPDVSSKGHALGFIKEAFPVLVFSQPIIEQLLKAESSSFDYRHAGWDKKDGRNCLVLEFFIDEKGSPKRLLSHKYWLDLERNGQPIFSEKYNREILDVRASGIELGLFTTDDGHSAWLPVKGRFQGFGLLFEPSSVPTSEQTFDLIRGTPRINQKMMNYRFNLDYGVDAPTLESIRKSTNRLLRSPRESAKENAGEMIRKALEAADRQAAPILAENPSWIARHALPIVLAVLGSCGVIVALVLARRQ